MLQRHPLSIAVAVMLVSWTPVFAQTVVPVSGLSDLYLAGQPSGKSCCAGDSAPAESPVLTPLTLSAGEYLTFSATGGTSRAPAVAISPTADGETNSLYNITSDYGTGIAGATQVYLSGLAGVFLGATMPSGPAPAELSGTSFSSISPGLNQIFFIGDGLTGTGTGNVQTFYVPTGATRLFLGVIDDGGYYDNRGTINATITPHLATVAAVPEPASWAMMVIGFGLVGLRTRYRRGGSVRLTLNATS